jgi:uncharacterized RDD family membrane protein YckC
MTQPPDDLERRPDGSRPDEPTTPEDQPTIAWTPPEPAGESIPDAAATPQEPTPPPPTDAPPPAVPPPPATAWEAPASTPPPASPIISASPTVPSDTTGVAQPPPAGPVVGWETPGPAATAPGREGYVIAGMGARLVAYFIDAVLVSIVPAILGLLVIDYGSLFQQIIDASRANAEGQFTQTNFVMAVTPELILVALIQFAIQFIYFVGFWTSGMRATPGMRGLKMQVVDAATGGTLSLTAATKRFVAMGSALALLIVVPALQSAASIAPFAVSLFLFFTAITNDRRQGLHDKWANSLVIRSTTSGDGATLVGCLLLIVLVVVLGIIASAVFFAAIAPQLQDLMREMENSI